MSGNVKKISIWFSIVLLLAVTAAALGPFYAMHQIRQGLAHQDTAILADAVDFPALKANIKVQLEGFLTGQAPSDFKQTPFAAFAMSLASRVVDGMVDAVVTPQGLAALLHGVNPGKLWQGRQASPPETTEAGTAGIFSNAVYHYDSPSQFSVWIQGEKDGRFQFVFTRSGLLWKLSNVIFPMGGDK
ncbi:DUF2939 domain-containing protein [Candidatus Methylospira mobilis]|uniref:DUF2939 domain-containing protein n=1 Tax=Candidatus Methylospira mobilis TaxID=1808979 RepID=A0A5Q0BEJ9_9GAMM|nr:DUF2939 domain-containing protein [Candidatus Methylospira mobilis]QFY41562.1 DUF2939 domain-containing protein [Candidatus Methylospira mobilis]WNV05197.1 DUF2939 domain-containing protein [Candidatus Methylospira mobilis]